tara:strand:+ start:323 stop:910 length:588 start_codon:yes stop_codon:yes gene_type:complete
MIRIFSYAFVIILALGLGANWIIEKALNSHDIPLIKPVPEFSFVNHKGKSFSNDNFQNKITVLDFMFTSCTGPCPLMTLNMSKLYEAFSNEREVQFVSITVDPTTDDQKKLDEYSDLIGVQDDRWHFLWSDLDSIKSLKREGFMLFADNLPQGHAIKFVLIDQNGNIRKYFDGTDDSSQEILKKDIVQLLKDFRS